MLNTTVAGEHGCSVQAYAATASPGVRVDATAYTVTMTVKSAVEFALVWDHDSASAE